MQALSGFNFSKAYDQRVYVNKPRSYAILQSASQVLPQTQSAVSGVSTQTITFNVNPSENSIIDRNMAVRYYLQFDFVGNTSGPAVNLISTATDVLKPLPVTTAMTNCTLQLNGQSFSNSPKDYVQALLRFCDPAKRNYQFSLTPSQPDYAQDYSVWNPQTNTIGLNRSPFAGFGDNTNEDSRGSFNYTFSNLSTTGGRVNVVVTEPLFISPLLWENQQAPGLVLLNQMSVQIQLSNLAASWSHLTVANGNTRTVTNISVSFTQAPELLYSELNPKGSVAVNRQIPYSYPYNHLYVQENNQITLNAGAQTNLTTNTVSLPVIPEKVYLFLKRSDSTRTYTTTETFAVIDRLSIKWGTQAGILSACAQEDLWKISVKNGLRMSWREWSQQSGSIVCLAFGDDIDLGDETSAPGLLTKLPLQIDMTVRNTSAGVVQYTPYVVIQYPGVVQCINGLYSQSDGIFTEQTLAQLQASSLPVLPYVPDTSMVFGGAALDNLYSGIKSGISKAKDFYEAAKPYMQALKMTPLAPAMSALGLGRKMKRGGVLTGGRIIGGVLTGGCDDCGNNNIISREEMLSRLEDDE